MAHDHDDLDVSELKSALEDFPKVVVKRVNALKNINTKYVEESKKLAAEIRAIEHRYQTEVFAPLFDKRTTIVNGSYEPTADESKAADPANEPTNNPETDVKGIPEFWLTVLSHNRFAADQIQEHDEDALKFLEDVKCANLPAPQLGFTITFHFGENPFFSNKVLTKTYHLEEDEVFGEQILKSAEGTTIDWKAGKNLTVRIVTSRQPGGKKGAAKGKKGSQARTVKKEEPQESFFQFFSPPQINDEDEEQDPEEEEQLEIDFDLGCTFKDKLVPFAALWFTGEAAEFDDEFGDEFDEDQFDDEEGDEDDDDEEDEDDEDDEPAPPPKGGRGGAKGGRGGNNKPFPPPAGAKGDPQQPECKQQ